MACKTCETYGYTWCRYEHYPAKGMKEYRFCNDCGEGSFSKKYPKTN